jgi:hypothetical protein
MKKLIISMLALMFLVSCNRDENQYLPPNSFTSIATVENPTQSSGFYFRLDNNDRMWVTATNFPYYNPIDGQRIIATYSILSVNGNNSSYNHKVSLNDVYEVLTKKIFKITPNTQDSIGNDPINITDLWVGSDFLNVEFNYQGQNKIHFINLVSDSTKTYTDGKVHLEFRHNANNDYPMFWRWGIVSFNLKSLQPLAVGDSVNMVIHTKEFGTTVDKSYNVTYKFGTAAAVQYVKKIIIPADSNKVL